MKQREILINVPLTEDERAALDARAKRNERAACREAAHIIRRILNTGHAIPTKQQQS